MSPLYIDRLKKFFPKKSGPGRDCIKVLRIYAVGRIKGDYAGCRIGQGYTRPVALQPFDPANIPARSHDSVMARNSRAVIKRYIRRRNRGDIPVQETVKFRQFGAGLQGERGITPGGEGGEGW